MGGACLFEVGLCLRARAHSPLLEIRLFLDNACLALREHDQPWPELV